MQAQKTSATPLPIDRLRRLAHSAANKCLLRIAAHINAAIGECDEWLTAHPPGCRCFWCRDNRSRHDGRAPESMADEVAFVRESLSRLEAGIGGEAMPEHMFNIPPCDPDSHEPDDA